MTVIPYPQTLEPVRIARPSWVDVMDRGVELAEIIANTDFVPKNLRGNQPAILAAVLYGHEVGLEPMQSLRFIAVIDGRPSMAAEAMRGRILAEGHEIWPEDVTNTRATMAGRRRDSKQTVRVTWTLDDAKRARIGGKPNWQAYPRQMLVARATAELARQIFADVIGGMAATEELDDAVETLDPADPETPRRAAAQAAADADAAASKPTTRRRRSRPTASPGPAAKAEPEPASATDAAGSSADAGERELGEPNEPESAEPTPAEPDPPNPAAMGMLFALFNEKGMRDRDVRLGWSEKTLGRKISSSTELSALDVTRLIEALKPLDDVAEPVTLPPNEQAVVDELKQAGATEVDPDGFERPPLPDD